MTNDTDTTTTRDIDWIAADNALRSVLHGCETGDRMRDAVVSILGDLRGMDPDDRDDAAGELAKVDNRFPYTFDRVQAFAESIHHATFEDDDHDGRSMLDGCGTPMDVVSNVVGAILYGATCYLIAHEA